MSNLIVHPMIFFGLILLPDSNMRRTKEEEET